MAADEERKEIVLNGFKGIWTLGEVTDLLTRHNLKVRIVFPTKDDQSQSQMKSSSLVEEGE